MTIRTIIRLSLFCDVPHCFDSFEGVDESNDSILRRAKSNGWQGSAGKHYCPAHSGQTRPVGGQQ